MKNKIMHYFASLATIAILVPVSCTRQEMDVPISSALSFSLYQPESITKASGENVSSVIQPLDMVVENAEDVALATSFKLLVSEQPLGGDDIFPAAEETRATPVYTENFGSFMATAYLPDNFSTPYLAEAEFKKSDNKWSHTYSGGVKWPEGSGKVVFFMRYPATPASGGWTYASVGGKNVISKTGYITPGAGESVTNAAEQQTDLVFATTSLTAADKDKTNKILFYHPFTGVKFKLGNLPEGLLVKSVTISGVKGKGDCVVTPYYGNDATYDRNDSNRKLIADATKSAACVKWDNLSDPESFTQAFVSDDHGTTPDSGMFPDGFANQGTTAPNQDQLNTKELSKTFILIPQSFTSSNKLEITLKLEYKGIELTRTAVTEAEWKAGSLYTYTIKFNSKIDVTITDKVNGNVKDNVVITNTGNVPEYIRAAIVGNWFDDSGNIVFAWTDNPEDFTGKPGSNWVKNGAWYYYKNPVAPGAETPEKLFQSYNAPEAPVSGAHLEMRIMVQAIIADDTVAQQSWGVQPSSLN